MKKQYFNPEMEIFVVEAQELLAGSETLENLENPVSDPLSRELDQLID